MPKPFRTYSAVNLGILTAVSLSLMRGDKTVLALFGRVKRGEREGGEVGRSSDDLDDLQGR